MRSGRCHSWPSRRRTVVSLSAAACLFAAGGSSPGAAGRQAPDGYPADGQPAIVKLISAGAEPRVPLRYRPAAGSTGRMDMRMEMGMTMNMGGMAMPSVAMPVITITADIAITEVAESGDFSYRTTFVDAGAESAPGVDPTMLSMLQGVLQSNLKGLTGTGTVSNRGVARSVTLDLDSVTDPQMRQTMGPMTSSLEQMTTPLPEESVGVGARWEVYQRLASGGMVMFQKVDVTVKAVDGNAITLDLAMEQQAPRQAVANPGMPAEVEVFLQHLAGSGTATTTIDLTSMIPTSAMSARSTATMEMSVGGSTQAMTVDTTVKMTMAPGR